MRPEHTNDRSPAPSAALERIRADFEARELGPIDAISVLEEVGALWFVLDYDEPAITASLLGWIEFLDVVDATAGTYHHADEFLRLNVRGRLADWPVVITLPAHYRTQPARAALIEQHISDRDPELLATQLAEQDLDATDPEGM